MTTIHGKPLTLIGKGVKIGERAPNATLVSNDLELVELDKYRGKILVISAVPSLDTPICEIETRKFNEKAALLAKDVVIVTISADLPFAQKRWCAAEGIERVVTLSDHREAAFGSAYGVLIKELRLLARTIFVVDKEGIIRYIQAVSEITNEPDYDAVINAVKELK